MDLIATEDNANAQLIVHPIMNLSVEPMAELITMNVGWCNRIATTTKSLKFNQKVSKTSKIVIFFSTVIRFEFKIDLQVNVPILIILAKTLRIFANVHKEFLIQVAPIVNLDFGPIPVLVVWIVDALWWVQKKANATHTSESANASQDFLGTSVKFVLMDLKPL